MLAADPVAANKAVMLTVTGIFLAFQVLFGFVVFLVPVSIGDAEASLDTYYVMMGVWCVSIFIALFVHKEPATGKGLLL